MASVRARSRVKAILGSKIHKQEDEKREYVNNKPVVFYSSIEFVEVGRQATLVPIDHPSERLNARTVWTSYVQAANADSGQVETINTVYRPHPSVKKPYFQLS